MITACTSHDTFLFQPPNSFICIMAMSRPVPSLTDRYLCVYHLKWLVSPSLLTASNIHSYVLNYKPECWLQICDPFQNRDYIKL